MTEPTQKTPTAEEILREIDAASFMDGSIYDAIIAAKRYVAGLPSTGGIQAHGFRRCPVDDRACDCMQPCSVISTMHPEQQRIADELNKRQVLSSTNPNAELAELRRHAPRATDHRCQKCGSPTQGEEAWIDGQIWCHPCADAVSVSSTYVHDAPAGPSGSQVISESFGSGTPLVSGKKPTSAECGSRPDGATAHSSTERETL
jgi:hypothetical protein